MKKLPTLFVAAAAVFALAGQAAAYDPGCGVPTVRRGHSFGSVGYSSFNRGSGFSFAISSGRTYSHGSRFGHGFGHYGHSGFHRGGTKVITHGRGFNRGWGHGVYHRPVTHFSRTVVIDNTPAYCPPTTTIVQAAPQPVVREVVREVPVYRETRVSTPAYREIDRTPNYGTGWDALAESNFGLATDFFSDMADIRPNAAAPKAGLAIARAAIGQDAEAIWAMRRAVRVGLGEARRSIPGYQMNGLIEQLEANATEDAYRDGTRWFMVAALRYLRGDATGAVVAADRAIEYNEHDGDARTIYELAQLAG